MNSKISDNVWNILVCPNCGSSLHNSNQCVICNNCQSHFRFTKSGAIDLRFHHTKTYRYNFTLGTPFLRDLDLDFGKLPVNSNPEVDFSNTDFPCHLSRKILSHFPSAKTENSLMLDLGCGNLVHKQVCEYAGFEYVGLDCESEEAPIIGDAHSLPFKDECFEFILSFSALQYFRFPFVAMKEAYRVLKPNGLFMGAVAFLEPFHGTFYHHTHWGTYNSLKEGGFEVEYICPSNKWSVLVAQASMALFPRMPRFFSQLMVMPIQMLHKIWWRIGRFFSNRAAEEIRVRNTTGSFTFICRK